jgi:hypothetical protein
MNWYVRCNKYCKDYGYGYDDKDKGPLKIIKNSDDVFVHFIMGCGRIGDKALDYAYGFFNPHKKENLPDHKCDSEDCKITFRYKCLAAFSLSVLTNHNERPRRNIGKRVKFV